MIVNLHIPHCKKGGNHKFNHQGGSYLYFCPECDHSYRVHRNPSTREYNWALYPIGNHRALERTFVRKTSVRSSAK